MTHPSPSLLDAIAEVCAWHSRVEMLHPMRTLPSGRREPILPTEIPQAIRKGEIEVPIALKARIVSAVFEGMDQGRFDISINKRMEPKLRHPPGAID